MTFARTALMLCVLAACADPRASASERHDAGTSDAGALPALHPESIGWPDESDENAHFMLSSVGVYRDLASKALRPDMHAYEPRYALWSDGADKQRWLYLPPTTAIDTSDLDHWQFPVGTLLLKEFSLDGKRLETRLIVRTGPGQRDYFLGAFAWYDDESDAEFLAAGRDNVRDTPHDIPKTKFCATCHDGEAGRILGVSLVQAPDIDPAWLSQPTPRFDVPGDDTTAAALGYLHANCGHCHNPSGTARPDTDMNLRLAHYEQRPEDTQIYRSTLRVQMQYFEGSPLSIRIVPGDPEMSGLIYRMRDRSKKTQMPPIASEFVDDDGVATVERWIRTLH